MKKKVLSLALALAMCLGLTVPTLALEISYNGAAGEGPNRDFTMSINTPGEKPPELGARSFRVRNWLVDSTTKANSKGSTETLSLTQVYELPAGSEIIIESSDGYVPDTGRVCQAWSDPDGDGVYDGRLNKSVLTYEFDSDGIPESLSVDTELLPVNVEGPFVESSSDETEIYYVSSWPISCGGHIYYHTEGYGGGLQGEPSKISADYLIGEFGANTLFRLGFEIGYDSEANKSICKDYYFLLTDGQTSDPEPTTPVIEVENIPASGTAVANTQTVTVDGKAVEFQTYALIDANGNAANYIKLRDMAYILNGTKAQFSVGYSNDAGITATSGQPYQPNGSEMNTPFSGDRAYTGGGQSVQINGKAVEMTAITLLDDNGGGYTYFKIRDLGKALGFNVGYSAERGVYIESDKPYVG